MQRAILLQIGDLTRAKRLALASFRRKAAALANSLLKQRQSRRLMDLHKATYLSSKRSTSFSSQVICDIERNVAKSRGKQFRHITVKFNVPRNCKTFSTKCNFFVEFGMHPRKRIAIPIARNRNFQRFQSLLADGWTCKTYGLNRNGIVAYLSKPDLAFEEAAKPVLGIDVNAKHFGISVLSPKGKVLHQTYLGKHIYVRRRKIMGRKAKMTSKRVKDRVGQKEANYVKSNLGLVVKEIIRIARRFDADIAIERLKKFKPKGKRFNKVVMKIPFYKFAEILASRCFDNNIRLHRVDSWHTSKWCSRCGAVGNGHSANYALFKCKECGQIVNSDRKASLAIAAKSLSERRHNLYQDTCFQFSDRRVPVNGLLWHNEAGLPNVAVQHANQPSASPAS